MRVSFVFCYDYFNANEKWAIAYPTKLHNSIQTLISREKNTCFAYNPSHQIMQK